MSRISQLAGRVAAFWNFAVHGAREPVATVGGATVPISRLSEAMRAVDAAPDYVSERTKREFAAGRRATYINSEGKLISFQPEKLAAAQKHMAGTMARLDREAAACAQTPPNAARDAARARDAQQAPSFEFPDHARIPERPAHFGKRKEPPPPLPLPKDTANICTMVIREDLAFLRRIEEIRLTGGRPAIIDFDRQADLSKVIQYAIETGTANGALVSLSFLRAWMEGSDAARAEFLAWVLEEKPY